VELTASGIASTVRRRPPSPEKVAGDEDPGPGGDHQRNNAKGSNISKPAKRSSEQKADRRRP
jgi:hypothetical protein